MTNLLCQASLIYYKRQVLSLPESPETGSFLTKVEVQTLSPRSHHTYTQTLSPRSHHCLHTRQAPETGSLQSIYLWKFRPCHWADSATAFSLWLFQPFQRSCLAALLSHQTGLKGICVFQKGVGLLPVCHRGTYYTFSPFPLISRVIQNETEHTVAIEIALFWSRHAWLPTLLKLTGGRYHVPPSHHNLWCQGPSLQLKFRSWTHKHPSFVIPQQWLFRACEADTIENLPVGACFPWNGKVFHPGPTRNKLTQWCTM